MSEIDVLKKENILEKFLDSREIKEILRIIDNLGLKEACLCAGAIRNNLWNIIDGKELEFDTDIDVIFYDKEISYEKTCEIEDSLKENYPKYNWELKNQVYMHIHSSSEAFLNVEEAISKFPETCTAVGIIFEKDSYKWIAPYGLEDIFNKIVRPTPEFRKNKRKMNIYINRVKNKKWEKKWKDIKVFYE
ncbi:nucleotidyltransferase family protein [Miniphocaeibacter massiliensis]|uniref:nucleotidyltransferase family protein n=1 Tax=Miniphocaeibacter massiliensis TaxID=2041841 RepID=UPI0013EBC7B8|nr:nucleotidyltransferase family protein [Miniphocaeibacter massiliensis]